MRTVPCRYTVLAALLLFGVIGCEPSNNSSFGTPTPGPTPWPHGDDDDDVSYDPNVTPDPRMLSSIPLRLAEAQFDGEYAADHAGSSLALVQDLDGDGFDDLAIGAPMNDDLQDEAGKVYLEFGSIYGPESGSLEDAVASFQGEGRDDRAGQTVVGTGDLNGDGYNDLLIGAPRNDLGGPNAGRIYVILGRSAGWYPDMRLTHADFSFFGEEGDLVGDVGTLSGGGDLNGDGYDDFAVGAPYDSESNTEAGKVYIVTGRPTGWEKKGRLKDIGFQLLGTNAQDWAGFSVAIVPDVNDDGFDDILIGAPHSSTSGTNSGEVYLFLGRPNLPNLAADVSNMANMSYVGALAGEEAGASVSGAGDVNGDGYEDFVIGAWGSTAFGSTGKFYIVDGNATYPANPDESITQPLSRVLATVYGINPYSYIGRPGLGVGDVDGDGRDDILLGDYLADNAGMFEATGGDCGAAYMFLGRSGPQWDLITEIKQADFFYYGEAGSDFAAYAIAGRGDINGDGYMDFAIGALGADSDAREDIGRTYLYYGGNPFQPPHYQSP